MGLEINREKTRVIDLKQKGASLDFLGFTFRYEPDHFGHGHQYLNVGPSKKAVKRERAEAARADQRSGSQPADSGPDR